MNIRHIAFKYPALTLYGCAGLVFAVIEIFVSAWLFEMNLLGTVATFLLGVFYWPAIVFFSITGQAPFRHVWVGLFSMTIAYGAWKYYNGKVPRE